MQISLRIAADVNNAINGLHYYNNYPFRILSYSTTSITYARSKRPSFVTSSIANNTVIARSSYSTYFV